MAEGKTSYKLERESDNKNRKKKELRTSWNSIVRVVALGAFRGTTMYLHTYMSVRNRAVSLLPSPDRALPFSEEVRAPYLVRYLYDSNTG